MSEERYLTLLGAVIPLGPTIMIGLLVAERLFPAERRQPSNIWKFGTSAPTLSWLSALVSSGLGIAALLLELGADHWMRWTVGLAALGSLLAFTAAMTETFIKRHFTDDAPSQASGDEAIPAVREH